MLSCQEVLLIQCNGKYVWEKEIANILILKPSFKENNLNKIRNYCLIPSAKLAIHNSFLSREQYISLHTKAKIYDEEKIKELERKMTLLTESLECLSDIYIYNLNSDEIIKINDYKKGLAVMNGLGEVLIDTESDASIQSEILVKAMK